MSAPQSVLRCLGSFQLVAQGEEVVLSQSRLVELLALLALSPDAPLTRSQIARHLWPDSGEKQARTNTRNLLYKLRKAWPRVEEAIAIDANAVAWQAQHDIAIDVSSFQAHRAAAAQAHSLDERIRLLQNAVDCYRGDFMPESYGEWALAARERLHALQSDSLTQLFGAHMARREYDDARRIALALCSHDRLQETAYQLLMRAYAALGDRAGALRTYHECATLLRSELGVDPAPTTQRLHARLLRHGALGEPPAEEAHAVARPRLVGRQPEWATLRRAWRQAADGKAHSVIIWGEAGIGKTRLAEEIVDWVGRQGHITASSRSYAAAGALSYAPIAEWLRMPRLQAIVEQVDDLWRVELARLLPSLLAERSDLPQPGPLRETWQQQRFFQAFVQVVEKVDGPLLLHFDDLQWSDSETLHLIQYLLHGARRAPLLIVGGIRSEEASENPTLRTLLDALRHAEQLTELHLTPLSRSESVELAQQTSDGALAVDDAARLYETSEGHPLYLIETVRSSLDDGGPRASTGMAGGNAATTGAGIPPKIYGLVKSRLTQLAPPVQQVANAAAVIGRDFTYDLLATTLAMDELELVDALDDLWTRRLIREQDGLSYDFSHDRIREVAYAEISRARRRLLHRQVAVALEALSQDRLDDVAGELAAHFAQAGESAKAFVYYRRAAEFALGRHALTQAAAMFDAALIHVPEDPATHFDLLSSQQRVLYVLLHSTRWRENLDTREALLARLPWDDARRAEWSIDRARFFNTSGRGKEGARAARNAVAIAERINDGSLLAKSHQELAAALWTQSRMAEAAPLFGRAAHYARVAGEQEIEATSLELYAATGMFSGMLQEEIHDLLLRSFAIAEAIDDKDKMADLYNKFGYLRAASGLGDFERTEAHYRQGLALARAIGNRRKEELILSNLGVNFTQQGDYRRARETLDACLAMGEANPALWRHQVSRHYLGALFMQMGQMTRARTELLHASEQLGMFGNHHFEVKARSDLGLAYHLAGDHRQARDELAKVLDLIAGHGDLRFAAQVSTRLGYALEALGNLQQAAQHYVEGQALHAKMGQSIYRLYATAGLARLALHQDDASKAQSLAESIWQALCDQPMERTVESARVLRTCYTIFNAHDHPHTADVHARARRQLQQRVSTIDDPAQVEHFWSIEDHRFYQP